MLVVVVRLLSHVSLWPHGLQHTRLLCLSLSPGVCSNSWLLSRWCYLPISSFAAPFSFCLQSFPVSESFPELSLHIRWPKYWSLSFDISPANEHSRLVSFRIDWFDLLAVQGLFKSLLQHYNSKASVLWHSAFFIPVTSEHDYWKNYSFDYVDLCQQSDASAF